MSRRISLHCGVVLFGVVPVSPEGEGWLRESRPDPVRAAGVHRRDRVTPGNFGDRWQGKGDRAHHVRRGE